MFVVALMEYDKNIRLDRSLTVNGIEFRPMRLDTDGGVKLHAIELERENDGIAHNGCRACGASASAIAGFFSLLEKQGWNVLNLDGFMRYHGLL
jgi:hypothetical protein